ncbi:hypothetical protein HDV02_005815 [Globomyces sp. JEL0801]|nr:hypothetical protein HDV02_005815 [Globomyces sp. JEL0801]
MVDRNLYIEREEYGRMMGDIPKYAHIIQYLQTGRPVKEHQGLMVIPDQFHYKRKQYNYHIQRKTSVNIINYISDDVIEKLVIALLAKRQSTVEEQPTTSDITTNLDLAFNSIKAKRGVKYWQFLEK